MHNNGKSGLRLAIPPGHVDARCLVCPADVVIPEGTLKCPNGDHDVEPTSLPRMPVLSRSLAEVDGTGGTSPAGKVSPLAAEPMTAAEPARPAVERIVLPEWMKEAQTWLVATERFATALAAEDANLTAEVRQVRGVRKLLDAVLDRVKPADPEATS
jgi:hypothetical protein